MNQTRRNSFAIPTESWTRIEEVIEAIGLHVLHKLEKKMRRAALDNILMFLQNIGFYSNSALTEVGLEYFRVKFLLNDHEVASQIVLGAISNYEPTQAICQLLWGRPSLKRGNVYKLLVHEEYIDPGQVREEDLGSFMMILNQCGVFTYNKRTDDVRILINPHTAPKPFELTRFFSPETPYSNLRHIWEVLRSCTGFVHWFDKNFSPKAFEVLDDEADGNNIGEIRLLSGMQEQRFLEKIKRDFERFREEMGNRQISSEFRVMSDKQQVRMIHDRWILSKDVCYNLPPINSMFMGQYSELKKTVYRPPFGEWWASGLDIVTNWQEIIELTTASKIDQAPVPSPLAG